MPILLVALALIALFWLALLISPIHRAERKQWLGASEAIPDASTPLPPVTAIIPARNEADNLPRTLPTICNQEYPDLRVILVDDQSDDDTPRILPSLQHAYTNLTIILGTPRPQGWFGKQWALKQGADRATTDWLLFTDADILYHPQAVRRAMLTAMELDLQVFSLIPRLICGSWVERIALAGAFSTFTILFPLSLANNPRRKLAVAAGAFILIQRKVYDQVGGHEAVKGRMIEDLHLARVLKQAGARMQTRFTDLLSTRMYEGWADLWEGLGKNAYAGIGYRFPLYLAGLVGGLVLGILPPVYLLASLIALLMTPSVQTALAVVLSVLIIAFMSATHGRMARLMDLPRWHCFLKPVSGVVYSAIVTHSVWQHHFGGGTLWKGRRYEREHDEAPEQNR